MTQATRRLLLAAFAAPALLPRGAAAQMRNLVDTMAADGRFDRFLEFIGRAGMTDQLRGAGPYTVFAPTAQAFNTAGQAMLDDLLSQGTGGGGSETGGGGTAGGASPDPVRLPAFVRYFIVPGQALTMAQLMALGDARLPTLNGAPLLVSARPGAPATVGNPNPAGATGGYGPGGLVVLPPAPIVQADIPATNGIIHAIAGVIAA